MTALEAYQWMLRFCAIGIVIDALEQLVRRRGFAEGGFYAWTILRRRIDLAPRVVRGIADVICAGGHRPVVMLGVRLAAVVAVAAAPAGSWPFAVALTVLLATQLYMFLRRAGFGIDGSDQMNLVTIGASWLAIVVAGTPEALRIGFWFIAAQSVLSYGINGTTKLAAASWRSGRAMPAALSTYTNGHPALYRVVAARPWLAKLACWGTIAWECAFPIVMVVPEPVVLPILVSGVLFHLSLAVTMGIHLFVWAFIAPYVAIWMVTR